jgi:hypothetical protein
MKLSKLPGLWGVVIIFALLKCFLPVASGIVVDSFENELGVGDCSDGAAAGDCSLFAAVEKIVADGGANEQVILLPAGNHAWSGEGLTIPPGSPPIRIAPEAAAAGRPVITGTDALTALFNVTTPSTLTLVDLELVTAGPSRTILDLQNTVLDAQGVTLRSEAGEGDDPAPMVAVTDSTVSFAGPDCSLTGGSNVYGGGLFILGESSVSFADCEIASNSAALFGGGIFFFGSGQLDITQGSLLQGNSIIPGLHGTPVNASDIFPGTGAAVWVTGDIAVTLSDSTFEENTLENENVNIGENPYTGGAALYGEAGVSVTATGCTFRKNDGGVGYGGALLMVDAPLVALEDCTFESNTVGVGGGAVAVLNDFGSSEEVPTDFSIKDCSFNENSVFPFPFVLSPSPGAKISQGGGAIYLLSLIGHVDLSITDTVFQGNTFAAAWNYTDWGFQVGHIVAGGGAITSQALCLAPCTPDDPFCCGVRMDMRGTTFSNNAALETESLPFFGPREQANVGGAIFLLNIFTDDPGYVGALEVSTTDCTFDGNVAFAGGGIYAYAATEMSYLRTSFVNNEVESTLTANRDSCTRPFGCNTGIGGAVSLHFNKAPITVDSCDFFNNKAAFGGGWASDVSQGSADLLIKDCNFEGNFAGIAGGAIGSLAEVVGVNIQGCTFTDNTAQVYGGAVYIQETGSAFSGNTFTGNSVTLSRDIDAGFTSYGGGAIAISIGARTVFTFGILAATIDITVDSCSFAENVVEGDGGDILLIMEGNLRISDSSFTGSRALSIEGAATSGVGGSIAAVGGLLQLLASQFSGCNSSLRGSCILSFTDTTIDECTFSEGAGLDGSLDGLTNIVALLGAGTVRNSEFTATSDAVMLSLSVEPVSVDYCTFDLTTAGSTGIVSSSSSLAVRNTVFLGRGTPLDSSAPPLPCNAPETLAFPGGVCAESAVCEPADVGITCECARENTIPGSDPFEECAGYALVVIPPVSQIINVSAPNDAQELVIVPFLFSNAGDFALNWTIAVDTKGLSSVDFEPPEAFLEPGGAQELNITLDLTGTPSVLDSAPYEWNIMVSSVVASDGQPLAPAEAVLQVVVTALIDPLESSITTSATSFTAIERRLAANTATVAGGQPVYVRLDGLDSNGNPAYGGDNEIVVKLGYDGINEVKDCKVSFVMDLSNDPFYGAVCDTVDEIISETVTVTALVDGVQVGGSPALMSQGCGVSFYAPDEQATVCEPCPEDAYCPPLSTGATVELFPGLWRPFADTLDISRCTIESLCLGGPFPTECSNGHEGALCNVCSSGFWRPIGSLECQECASAGTYLYSFFSVIALVALGWLLLWLFRAFTSQGLGKEHRYLRRKVSFLLSVAPACLTHFNYHLAFPLTDIVFSIPSKVAMIICSFQLGALAPEVTQVPYQPPYRYIATVMSSWNLDFLRIFPFACSAETNFYDELLEMTLLPLIVMVLAWAAARLGVLGSWKEGRRKVTVSALLGWAIIYPGLSAKILQTFQCVDLGEGSNRLTADYSLFCSGSTYKSYVVYALVMVVIHIIGYPVVLVIVAHASMRRTKRDPGLQDVKLRFEALGNDDEGSVSSWSKVQPAAGMSPL